MLVAGFCVGYGFTAAAIAAAAAANNVTVCMDTTIETVLSRS